MEETGYQTARRACKEDSLISEERIHNLDIRNLLHRLHFERIAGGIIESGGGKEREEYFQQGLS